MEIKLNIQVPSDNTNTPHGNLTLKEIGDYTYITIENKTVAVDTTELYKAVNALY